MKKDKNKPAAPDAETELRAYYAITSYGDIDHTTLCCRRDDCIADFIDRENDLRLIVRPQACPFEWDDLVSNGYDVIPVLMGPMSANPAPAPDTEEPPQAVGGEVVYRTGGLWPHELDDGYVDARQPITTIRDLEQAGYVVSITKEAANDHVIQTR